MLISEQIQSEGGNNEVDHEHDKMSLIVQPYTLVDPRTMMVVLEHACIAYPTMVSSFWSEFFAFPTLGRRC